MSVLSFKVVIRLLSTVDSWSHSEWENSGSGEGLGFRSFTHLIKSVL